jgi:hypothetical protein
MFILIIVTPDLLHDTMFSDDFIVQESKRVHLGLVTLSTIPAFSKGGVP